MRRRNAHVAVHTTQSSLVAVQPQIQECLKAGLAVVSSTEWNVGIQIAPRSLPALRFLRVETLDLERDESALAGRQVAAVEVPTVPAAPSN